VAVLAVETEDGEGYLAKLVFIIEPSEYGRVTGEIKEIGDDEIEIYPDDEGAPDKFDYDGDTVFSLRLQGTYKLKTGMEVSITYVEDDEEYYAKTVTTVRLQPATD
jgi:hypothetical protein